MNNERMRLVRALTKASNAFHDSLRESGYNVSYGLNDFHTGSIYDSRKSFPDSWPLGDLTIQWTLKNISDDS